MDKNLEQWCREQYLDSIEGLDDKMGQAFEVLDPDAEEEFKEINHMKYSESLRANGLHIIKAYV